MSQDKLIEAQTEFGMYPNGGIVDETIVALAKPIISGMKQEKIEASIEALRPVVLDACARREHEAKLDAARHAKLGRYGFVRATIKAIRKEISRRGVAPDSSMWKESIEVMRSRPDDFRFAFADRPTLDASDAVHGTKSAADCKGIICTLIEDTDVEHVVKMSSIGQYLKDSR